METQWEFVKEIYLTTDDTKSTGARRLATQRIFAALKSSPKPVELNDLVSHLGYAYDYVKSTLSLLKRKGAVRSFTLKGNKRVDLDGLLRFPSVKRWAARLKKGNGRRSALYSLLRFHFWLKENTTFSDPEALIQNALDCTMRELESHIDLIQKYISSLRDVGESTRERQFTTIRSFYYHNKVRLDIPKNFSFSPSDEDSADDTPAPFRVDGDPQQFIDMMKKAISFTDDPLARAIMLTMFQSGMDDSTLALSFNYYAYAQLCDHFKTRDHANWDLEKVPVRIHLIRPKVTKGRRIHNYYTFIDRDAVEAIKDWLSIRLSRTGSEIQIYHGTRQDHLARSDPIFITQTQTPVAPSYCSRIFRVVGVKAGINIKPAEKVERHQGARIRYPFHSHECRDSLKTLGHKVGCVIEADYFIGHSIDKYNYDKLPEKDWEFFLEKYCLMRNYLNIMSFDPEKGELAEQVKAAKKRADEAEVNLSAQLIVVQKQVDQYNEAFKVLNDPEIVEFMKEWRARRQAEATSP